MSAEQDIEKVMNRAMELMDPPHNMAYPEAMQRARSELRGLRYIESIDRAERVERLSRETEDAAQELVVNAVDKKYKDDIRLGRMKNYGETVRTLVKFVVAGGDLEQGLRGNVEQDLADGGDFEYFVKKYSRQKKETKRMLKVY